MCPVQRPVEAQYKEAAFLHGASPVFTLPQPTHLLYRRRQLVEPTTDPNTPRHTRHRHVLFCLFAACLLLEAHELERKALWLLLHDDQDGRSDQRARVLPMKTPRHASIVLRTSWPHPPGRTLV